MNHARVSPQRGAVDQRVLIGAGAALLLGGAFAMTRSRPPRPPPPPVVRRAPPVATPPPPPAPDVPPPPPRVENDFHVQDPGMPSFSEGPSGVARRPGAPARRVIPASSGDYSLDVASLVRPAIPGLQQCLARSDPRRRGSVEVWFTIDPRGDVREAHLAADAGATVDQCMLTALRTVAFASPGVEAATFGIPIPLR